MTNKSLRCSISVWHSDNLRSILFESLPNNQDEFTQYKQGRIFVGTWNVNAKGKDESLSSWLCADWHQHGPPDIVVVGFQEIVDLNAVNVAVENKSQQRSQFWVDRIRSTLNARENTMGDPMRAYTQLAVREQFFACFVYSLN